MTSSARHPVTIGEKYTIEDEIGRGGMASVYSAHDHRHNRRIAVKVLAPELAASLGTSRFLHEIAVVAALAHPNIVPVYDSGEQDGMLYYVMPRIEGQTLRQVIRSDQRISLAEVVRIASRVAAALDFAHRHGIVHRDIKPENIILFEGEPLVLDFGIAKALTAAGGENLTATGIAVGTAAYLSPEQASGDETIDGRSDQYSLGCVLYELVAGVPPFTGKSTQSVIAKRFTGRPPDLSIVAPGTPEAFSAVVARALSLEPEDRYATVGELVADLARSLHKVALPEKTRSDRRSLAVLPFANVSRDPDNDFLADGISEEIINALTRVRALRVMSRTASFAFKERHEDLDVIARKLRVDNVLEGSVRKSGNRLRVTVQLVEVSSGDSIWSDRYDRELADIFAIQDEISSSIVDALKVVLSGEEQAAIKRVPTQNIRAYEHYLRGRQLYHQRRVEALIAAEEMFLRAIELDGNYALAYAGLADSLSVRFGSFGAGDEALSRAETAAKRALALDPSLAEAHSALGLVRSYQARFDDAETEFRKAIALDPVSFDTAYHYARMLGAAGDLERSGRMFEHAASLRPEDYQSLSLASGKYLGAGLGDAAQSAAIRAIEACEHALVINPGDARALSLGASNLLAIGEPERGREWIARALEMDPTSSMVVFNACCFESIAGNGGAAMTHLERAIELGFHHTSWLMHDPDLNNIRGLPGFADLVSRTEK